MKKIVFVSAIALLAFGKIQQEKKIKVEFTEREWDVRIRNLNYVKSKLEQSDLPSKEVKLINDSVITKLQLELIEQIQPQLATRDSSGKKK